MRQEIKALANVADAKPAAIDAVWFEAENRLAQIAGHIASYQRQAEDPKLARASDGGAASRAYYLREAERIRASYAAEVASLNAVVAPLAEEWGRRGGWSRFLICHSDNGHFHKRGCHTLWRAQVSWVADLSGLSENEVIEAVGFKACSQPDCFPLAPVHPAWAASEAKAKEVKQADRDARYAKGLAVREKKVANIEKRLAKARERLNSRDEYERSNARYDIEWNERDLVWAKREVARWLAKR
jgi:hypothetical protein